MVCRSVPTKAHQHCTHLNGRSYASKSSHADLRKSAYNYRSSNATLPLPNEPRYQNLQSDLQRLVRKNLPPVPNSFITSENLVTKDETSILSTDRKKPSEVNLESINELRKECEDLKKLIENRDKEIKMKVDQLFQKLNTI